MIYKHIVNVGPTHDYVFLLDIIQGISICSDGPYHHLFAMNYECALITEMTKHKEKRISHHGRAQETECNKYP